MECPRLRLAAPRREQMTKEQGIQGLVLGCTELPTILNSDITPVPCLDTVKIHVAAIIREIMKD